MKKTVFILMTFFAITGLSLLQVSCSGKKSDTQSTTVKESNSQTSYDCPHCNGTGQRKNGVTGEYGKCNTCSGTGKLTKEQYDRASK